MLRFNDKKLVFKPTLLGWLITLIFIPLFINFGQWQYAKAQKQKQRQTSYQQSDIASAEMFPQGVSFDDYDALSEQWNYRKVTVKGVYDKQHQFLLDNQVHDTRAGYHVITPLKIDQSDEYVLINRGWVPALATHSELPEIKTTAEPVTLSGMVWVPSKKYFTLEDKTDIQFKKVWQFMDISLYQQTVPIKLSSLAIKLDPQSEGGGFARQWQVSFKRIATHISYAYQWFGFAVATLMIFIYMSVKPVEAE